MTDSRPTGSVGFSLRPYEARDEDAAVALWLQTWQATYPKLDFVARLDWWRARWRDELVPTSFIVIAEDTGGADMIGFVTVDARTLYLDQIVVAPERWSSGVGLALIDEAKRISPKGLELDVNTDNTRAIVFYGKCGFSVTGAGKNQLSGKPVHRMSWRP
jgi:putative acetyltransferase